MRKGVSPPTYLLPPGTTPCRPFFQCLLLLYIFLTNLGFHTKSTNNIVSPNHMEEIHLSLTWWLSCLNRLTPSSTWPILLFTRFSLPQPDRQHAHATSLGWEMMMVFQSHVYFTGMSLCTHVYLPLFCANICTHLQWDLYLWEMGWILFLQLFLLHHGRLSLFLNFITLCFWYGGRLPVTRDSLCAFLPVHAPQIPNLLFSLALLVIP